MKTFVAEQPSQYQTMALNALAHLADGNTRPKTLHTLRTTLRRLQAFLELEGDEANAAMVSRCVSRFSPLRTLQVFTRYLARIGAAKSDLAILQKAIEEAWNELGTRQICHKIERRLWRVPFTTLHLNAHSLQKRVRFLYQHHVNELEALLAAAIDKPRRKRIHAIRLKIKTIRYQEECLLGHQRTRSQFLKRLKEVQARIGKYEELAGFRKLAKSMDLESRPTITRDWRRARKRARTLPAELGWIINHVNHRRYHSGAHQQHSDMAI